MQFLFCSNLLAEKSGGLQFLNTKCLFIDFKVFLYITTMKRTLITAIYIFFHCCLVKFLKTKRSPRWGFNNWIYEFFYKQSAPNGAILVPSGRPVCRK